MAWPSRSGASALRSGDPALRIGDPPSGWVTLLQEHFYSAPAHAFASPDAASPAVPLPPPLPLRLLLSPLPLLLLLPLLSLDPSLIHRPLRLCQCHPPLFLSHSHLPPPLPSPYACTRFICPCTCHAFALHLPHPPLPLPPAVPICLPLLPHLLCTCACTCFSCPCLLPHLPLPLAPPPPAPPTRVIAFEPVPHFRAFLEYNVHVNNFGHLVEIRDVVVSNQVTGLGWGRTTAQKQHGTARQGVTEGKYYICLLVTGFSYI